MEPARLAASKQAARKQLDPQGPWRAPKQQGSRGRKKYYPAIQDGRPQFCHIFRLPGRTPRGGKSQNTGILGHFGPGRPLALGEVPGTDRKRKDTQFPGAMGPETEKKRYHAIRDGCPQLFFTFFTFWPTGPPRAENHEIRGF